VDVLTLVAQKLSFVDRVKMAGICSAWRWAALGGSRSPFDDEGDGEACQCLKGDREAVFKHLKYRGGHPKDLESARRFRGLVQRLFRFTAAEAVEMGVVMAAVWASRFNGDPGFLAAGRAVWPQMDAELAVDEVCISYAFNGGPALLLELQAWGVFRAPSFGPRLFASDFSWIKTVESVRDLRRVLAVLRGLGVTALPIGKDITKVLQDAMARPELGFLGVLRHELGVTIEHVREGTCVELMWKDLARETCRDANQLVLLELVSWGLGREDVQRSVEGSSCYNVVVYAASMGNIAMLRVLARVIGVTKDDVGPDTLNWVLLNAVWRGKVEMVRVLAREFALTVEDTWVDGDRLLREAAEKRNEEMVVTLHQELGLMRKTRYKCHFI